MLTSQERYVAYGGAHVKDVTDRLADLILSTDNYPLLLFHMGSSDTDRSRLKSIKKDYRALETAVQDSGVWVVFFINRFSQVEGI